MELLNRLAMVDQRIFLRCVDLTPSAGLRNAAKAISKTGDGYAQVLLPTLLLFTGASGQALFALALAAFILERGCYWVLKNTLRRQRPAVKLASYNSLIKASDEFSFPSGHTSAAFLLAALVSAHFPALAIPLFAWAGMIACARVVLGVHFPADVLAGMTLGLSIAALML